MLLMPILAKKKRANGKKKPDNITKSEEELAKQEKTIKPE